MSIADIEMLLSSLADSVCFLYGMHVRADGLQKSARRQNEAVVGYFDESSDTGCFSGRAGDGGDSEFVGDDSHGCRFC